MQQQQQRSVRSVSGYDIKAMCRDFVGTAAKVSNAPRQKVLREVARECAELLKEVRVRERRAAP